MSHYSREALMATIERSRKQTEAVALLVDRQKREVVERHKELLAQLAASRAEQNARLHVFHLRLDTTERLLGCGFFGRLRWLFGGQSSNDEPRTLRGGEPPTSWPRTDQ